MGKLIEDALRASFSFIGQSVEFIVGLLGVVLVTALSLSGEILDDLTTYKTQPVDWLHVAKVVIPPCAVAMAAYIQHRRLVVQALITPPPAEKREPGWSAPRRAEAPRSELLSRARQRPV
jgi:hypothetical protein